MMYGNSQTYNDEKEKIYEHQLSKISEVDDDFFSSDFSQNINYGIIPLNVLHNIMLFQVPPDLLSMSLSCSLFCRAQNSLYFWKTYHSNFFKIESRKCKREGVNWKKEFVKRYFFHLVYTWGYGDYGGLGHGKTNDELIPKLLEKLVPFRIKNLFCGSDDCCSVVSNGGLLSWGWNRKLLLGYEKNDHKILSPESLVQLPENRKISQVTHGTRNSFFLDDFGDIWGCGSNYYGVLTGKNNNESFHQPVKLEISGSPKIKIIFSGSDHFGCICSSGKLYTWGCGGHGQLGHGNTSDVPKPQIVKYFENIRVKDVSMGGGFTLVLSEDGKIYSTGYGSDGQLGTGKIFSSYSPELIKIFCDSNIVITKISCGGYHSGCLDSEGNCYKWGRGDCGEMGNGSNNETNKNPIRISSFIDSSGKIIDFDIPNRHKFIQLECGQDHNIALLEDSTFERKTLVLTWGMGNFGRLGIGTENNMNIPTVVPFFENKVVRSVHCGGRMSAVIL